MFVNVRDKCCFYFLKLEFGLRLADDSAGGALFWFKTCYEGKRSSAPPFKCLFHEVSNSINVTVTSASDTHQHTPRLYVWLAFVKQKEKSISDHPDSFV